MKLTKRVIETTSYHGKTGTAHYLWDDEIAGFAVRIYPSGRKSFVIADRAKGRQRFHTVGRFGEMTLHEARTEALEKLAKIRRGADPSGDRQAYRESPTMADLAERHMREHARLKNKPKTVRNDERSWRNHILPRIGTYKVVDVTRADVTGLHTEMAETPYAANRVVALLSKAFNLAEVWGWRRDGSNPCRHVTRFKEHRMERYLSQEELTRLADALAQVERERSEGAGHRLRHQSPRPDADGLAIDEQRRSPRRAAPVVSNCDPSSSSSHTVARPRSSAKAISSRTGRRPSEGVGQIFKPEGLSLPLRRVRPPQPPRRAPHHPMACSSPVVRPSTLECDPSCLLSVCSRLRVPLREESLEHPNLLI